MDAKLLLFELLKRHGYIEFAVLWTAFGIFGLVKIQGWEADHKADFQAIDAGNAKPVKLVVKEKTRQRKGGDTDHGVHLGNDAKPRIKYYRLPKWHWDNVEIEDQHTGYHVHDRIRVREFDRGNFHLGRWASIGVMIVPGLAALALTFYSAAKASSHDESG